MTKVFENLLPNDVMGYYSAIGNRILLAKDLKELGQDTLAEQALTIAAHYLDYLTSDVWVPPTGVAAFFNPNEKLSFHFIRARSGYDTKTVHKMIKEALKLGTLASEGEGRRIRYFIPMTGPDFTTSTDSRFVNKERAGLLRPFLSLHTRPHRVIGMTSVLHPGFRHQIPSATGS